MIRAPGSCAARVADSPCGRAMKISSASPSVSAVVVVKFLPSKARVTGEVRVDRGDWLARAAARGHRRDLQVGVPGEQAEEFAARVAAGARDSDPYAHADASFSLREYASHCMNMQDVALAVGTSAPTGSVPASECHSPAPLSPGSRCGIQRAPCGALCIPHNPVASLSTARRTDRLKATETDHVHLCDQRSIAAALADSGPLPPGPFIDQFLEHVPPGKVRDGIGEARRPPSHRLRAGHLDHGGGRRRHRYHLRHRRRYHGCRPRRRQRPARRMAAGNRTAPRVDQLLSSMEEATSLQVRGAADPRFQRFG